MSLKIGCAVTSDTTCSILVLEYAVCLATKIAFIPKNDVCLRQVLL